MLDDNSDSKSLLKKMNHYPKAYFLYNPEGHYSNAMALYQAVKRTLDQKYYGMDKKKRTPRYADGDEDGDAKVSFKGTPFHTCEIPYDVFHMNRRTKLFIK